MNNDICMMTDSIKQRVSAFWPGGELPLLACLSLRSYLAHGMDVHLWSYHACSNVPEGIILRDAAGLIPEEQAFIHEQAGWEPFANLLRDTLLAREGGWWTELDIVCLKEFVQHELPWFPEREPGAYGTGLMGFPTGHPMMECLRLFSEDPAAVMPWDGPREMSAKQQFALDCADVTQRRKARPQGSFGQDVFTKAVIHFGLSQLASPVESVYPVHESAWQNCYNGWLGLKSRELKSSVVVCLWGSRLENSPELLDNVDKNSIVGQLIDTYLPMEQTEVPVRKKVNILVGICSCCKARERRDTVRATWMKHPVEGIEALFFVGHRKPLVDESEDTVSLWASDTYAHLPEKVLAFFRYALEHYDFEWLFKCDDDSYVALDRLEDLLDDEAELIGDDSLANRGAPSGGAGYFISRRLVEKIVACENIAATGPEDIIFGELALRLGAVPKSSSRLCMHSGRYPLPDNDQVSSHWCKPRQLHALECFYYQTPLMVAKAIHKSWKDEIEFYAGGYFRRRGSGCSGLLYHKGSGIFSMDWFHWGEEFLFRSDSGHYIGDQLSLIADASQKDLALLIDPDFSSRTSANQPLNVQLSTSKRKLDDWMYFGYPEYDIKQSIPLPDSCVDACYVEHVIECMTFREALHFLHEAWRSLKPGGVMRLLIADVSRIVDYSGMISAALAGQLKDDISPVQALLRWMEDKLEHKSYWSKELLLVCLGSVGFDVTVHESGQSSLRILSGLEPPQSMFNPTLPPLEAICLEAVKPLV